MTKKWCAKAAKLEHGHVVAAGVPAKCIPIPRVVGKKNGDLKVVFRPNSEDRTDKEWLLDCASTAKSQMSHETEKRCRRIARQLDLVYLGKLAINYINAAPQDVEDYRELRDAVRAYEARKGRK